MILSQIQTRLIIMRVHNFPNYNVLIKVKKLKKNILDLSKLLTVSIQEILGERKKAMKFLQ